VRLLTRSILAYGYVINHKAVDVKRTQKPIEMKATVSLRQSSIEKAPHTVGQPLPIVWSAIQKKMVLVCILLTNVLITSVAQKTTGLLSIYDSCHVHPLQQTRRAAKSLRVGSPILRVAYVIPSNRTPQPNGVANLQHAIKLGQQFFKEQMMQNGFGPKTFVFETEEDGVTPLINVVHVAETDEYLRGDLWGRTQQAAATAGISLWAEGEVWVVIPEAYVMRLDGSGEGGVALGAGNGSGISPGVAMIGSNALPLFNPAMITNDTPYDGKVLPELGPYPMKQDVTFASFEGTTFSSIASSWLGALWHETSHAFGLSHDFRNDNNFHGNLMGNGLRGTRGSLFPEKYPQDYTRLEYASSLLLNVSHYFNRDTRIADYGPNLTHAYPASVIPEQGLVHIPFQASDVDSLSFAYLRQGGNLIAEIVLKNIEAADTVFAVPYYDEGAINQYSIALYDKQGNLTYSDLQFNVPAGYNRAPIPFIQLNPPVPGLNQSITLNASLSYDVDNDQASLLAAWDLDNDGQFDTEPDTRKTLQYQYKNPGNYLIRLKLTDPAGAQTVSTAVSIKIPGEKTNTIESLTLIDAGKGEAVADLQDGLIINQTAWEGKTFSIRANISPGSPGIIDRVEFQLNGPIVHEQIDMDLPYALFGNGPSGDYIGRALLQGDYTITATPFSGSEKGIPLTVSFKVKGRVGDKTIGGTGGDDIGIGISTQDGGYVLGGYSSSNASGDKSENSRGATDYWIVKIDAQYNKLWDKTFGGTDIDQFESVISTTDGGYLIGGSSNSDISGDKTASSNGSYDYWIVKTDDQGNKLWDKSFGGEANDLLSSVVATADGGYILAGRSESDASGDKSENVSGADDFWIIKIDSKGNKEWDRTIGGSGSDGRPLISAGADGTWLLCGNSSSDKSGDKSEDNKGGQDFWVVKIDNQGNKVWDKTIGGNDNDNMSAVIPAPDGGYLLVGSSISDASEDKSENSKGGFDYWVVKIDDGGNKVWDKTLGGVGRDAATCAVATPDGGYLVGGVTNSDASGDKSEDVYGYEDYWVVKIGARGDKLWDKNIGGTASDNLASTLLTDGGYLLTGSSNSNASGDKTENTKDGCCISDYWIVELQDSLNTVAVAGYDIVDTSGKLVRHLSEGDVLDLDDLKCHGQTVVANTTGQIGSVKFDLNNAFFMMQNASPYTLTGDNYGTYFEPWIPKAGTYALTATPYSESDGGGVAYKPLTIHFTVKPETAVASYDIVNTSGILLRHLNEGDILFLDDLKINGLTIVANTTDEAGSVKFDLNGKFFMMQNALPYTLTGDNYGTFFKPWIPHPGSYTLTATPYSESDAGGCAGQPLTIHFMVKPKSPSAVVSYDIVDTSGKLVHRLNEGDVLYLNDLKSKGHTIVANATGRPGSVKFDVNNVFFMMQNAFPFTLTGDNYGTYFTPWIPQAGAYAITATPYSQSNADGIAGRSLTLHVTVVDKNQGAVSSIAAGGEDDSIQRNGVPNVTIYPVPVDNELAVRIEDRAGAEALVTIRNIHGLVVYQGNYSNSKEINTSQLASGVYVLQITGHGGFQKVVKFIKN
jgi:hypothetical protein